MIEITETEWAARLRSTITEVRASMRQGVFKITETEWVELIKTEKIKGEFKQVTVISINVKYEPLASAIKRVINTVFSDT